MNQIKLIFFAHPAFLGIRSINNYTQLLSTDMKSRGYVVEIWSPKGWLSSLPLSGIIHKWLGYLDLYVIFPLIVWFRIKKCPLETLFVFTDNAQGPWVPIIAKRKHVIHCHDFLALRSALGEIEENRTGWAGRQYQAFIRQGLIKGRNFISVSEKTKNDLHRFLPKSPILSEVVYNVVQQKFVALSVIQSRIKFGKKIGLDLRSGYLLHVGGNTWYKNRRGVINLYNAYRLDNGVALPLILIGEKPSSDIFTAFEHSSYKRDIIFLQDVDDDYLQYAYKGAQVFIFPSLEEGFGWPIAEALARGCPVITTNEAPMTEVGGQASFYIKKMPNDNFGASQWAKESSQLIKKIVELSPSERNRIVKQGLLQVEKFNSTLILDRMNTIYLKIIGE